MGRVDDQPESNDQQPADQGGEYYQSYDQAQETPDQGSDQYYQSHDQAQEVPVPDTHYEASDSDPNAPPPPPNRQAPPPPPPSYAPQRPHQAVQFPPQSPQMAPPQGRYPPQQGQQPQAYPPQQGQPQAYPPQQGQQPQAYPPQQGQQPQAYPPQQGQQPQAYPPQQGQPQANYPPQQFNNYSHVQAQQQSYNPAKIGYQQGMPGTPPQAQMGYQGMPGTPNKAAPGFPMAQQFGTENWSSDLFDCMDDPENALITACFPCVTFGQIAEILDNGATPCATSGLLYGCIAFLIGCPCIMSCGYRSKLRTRYQLIESPAPDWMTHCFCEWCALCQEYRELKSRDLDPAIGWQGNLAKQQQIQMQQASMRPPINQTMMG